MQSYCLLLKNQDFVQVPIQNLMNFVPIVFVLELHILDTVNSARLSVRVCRCSVPRDHARFSENASWMSCPSGDIVHAQENMYGLVAFAMLEVNLLGRHTCKAHCYRASGSCISMSVCVALHAAMLSVPVNASSPKGSLYAGLLRISLLCC